MLGWRVDWAVEAARRVGRGLIAAGSNQNSLDTFQPLRRNMMRSAGGNPPHVFEATGLLLCVPVFVMAEPPELP